MEKNSLSLSLSRRPDSARAKSIFAVQRSIVDNERINGVKMCPVSRARQFFCSAFRELCILRGPGRVCCALFQFE